MRTPHLFLALLLLTSYDALAAPDVTTLPATQISSTNATLNAAVIPSGPTYAWFEYGTTTNYGLATTPFQILNIGSPNLSVNVSNLSGATTYHYRRGGDKFQRPLEWHGHFIRIVGRTRSNS